MDNATTNPDKVASLDMNRVAIKATAATPIDEKIYVKMYLYSFSTVTLIFRILNANTTPTKCIKNTFPMVIT